MKKWICVFFLLTLTACGDKIEIEEEGFVIAVGMDLPEDEDAKGIDVTFKLANPVAGQQGGQQTGEGEEQEEAVIITIRAPDILSARDLANTAETRRMNYFHTKAIVISEELARSNEFLKIVSSIQRERQIRGDMTLMISKERASDYLRNSKSALEASPHKYYEFMERRWEKIALVPESNMHSFFHGIEADKGAVLAIYSTTEKTKTNKEGNEDEYLPGEIDKTGGTDIQIIGSAVFQDGKMIATLDGEETRLALLLRLNIEPEEMILTYLDPLDEKERIIVKGYALDTSVVVNTDKPKPEVDVTVSMDMRVLSIPSMIDYVEDLEKQDLLKKHIEKELEKKTMDLVRKTQEQFKGEPFYWSMVVRKSFLTINEFEKYNWREKYPNANVKVKYKINLRDFGKKLKPHHEEEIREEG